VIPDSVDLEIREMKSMANVPHEQMVRMCDSQMSKAVLGGTLTTDAGDHGARSLGDTQREDQVMLAVSDATTLAESMRWGLLAPMVRYQFGLSAPVPLLKFAVEPEESLNELAERYERLAKAGAAIPMTHIYEKFGIPVPRPGEAILIPRRTMNTDTDEIAKAGDGVVSDAPTGTAQPASTP